MEKLLTSHHVVKLLNVLSYTLRRWEKVGNLKPLRTAGGHRRYKESQVMALIGEEPVMIAMVTSFSTGIYGKRGGRVATKLVQCFPLVGGREI